MQLSNLPSDGVWVQSRLRGKSDGVIWHHPIDLGGWPLILHNPERGTRLKRRRTFGRRNTVYYSHIMPINRLD